MRSSMPTRPITFAEIPALSAPITEEIVSVEPDLIIACDTGARLVAFAIEAQLELRGQDELAGRMHHLAVSSVGAISLRHMVQQAKELPVDREAERIFVIDDAACFGGTLTTTKTVMTWAFPQLNAEFYNGVLVDAPSVRPQGEPVVHVSGMEVASIDELRIATQAWDGDTGVRGVRREPCRAVCHEVSTPASIAARQEILAAIQFGAAA
jgi:hypothetical protein